MDQRQKETLIRAVTGSISALIRDTLALDRAEIAHQEGMVDSEHLAEIRVRVRDSKRLLEQTLELLLL